MLSCRAAAGVRRVMKKNCVSVKESNHVASQETVHTAGGGGPQKGEEFAQKVGDNNNKKK